MKVNLYVGSRKVKTVKLNRKQYDINNLLGTVVKKDYKVTIIGHKDIFGKWIVTTILRPTALLINPTSKEIDLNCVVSGGAKIE